MMETENDVKHIGTIDMLVMFLTIGAAILVGIYYAIVDRKKSVDNYYYGGRQMSPIPVGMSIAATYISAITVIGFPAETYLYGTILYWFSVSAIIPSIVACIYYIPMIHRLRLSTINEYLELRFNRQLRQISSAISLFNLVFYMGLTVYIPALALNAVTPLGLFTTITITSVVCTTYTTLGGMKAVVWTDAVQTVAMVMGGLAAMIKTIMNVGGLSRVLEVSYAGGRRNFWNFDPNPTLRYTFWSYIFGKAVQGCNVTCISQATCQRYLSCGSIKRARIAALFSMVPLLFINGIAVLTGLAMYVNYEGCDPLKLGKIKKPDQLLPYLAVDVFEDLPGIAGLFVAAAFSGTLSSVSSGLNSLSVLILEDFVLLKKPNLSEALRLTFSKIIAISRKYWQIKPSSDWSLGLVPLILKPAQPLAIPGLYDGVLGIGIIVMCLSFLISFVDATNMRIGLTISGCLTGPLLGVYTLGAFIPSANSKGAAIGQIIATAFISWISFGSLLEGKMTGGNLPLPTSIDKCPIKSDLMGNSMNDYSINSTYLNQNFTTAISLTTNATEIHRSFLQTTLYAVSFLYYATISLVTTVLIGYGISLISGPNDPKKADPSLFIPLLDNPIFPEKIRKFFRFGVPESNKKKCIKEKFSSSLDSNDEITKLHEKFLNKESTM